jgi:hypothetical protein
MSTEPADWETITPQRLVPAVEHIRNSFETDEWKVSDISQKLCYAVLHPEGSQLASLTAYKAPFGAYRQMVGSRVQREFDDLLRLGTAPAVFRAYFDLYYEGLQVATRGRFNSMLEIGLANSEALEVHPVEWAKSQLKFLINGTGSSAERWIKEVCDTKEQPGRDFTDEQFEELVFWRKWRAPRLIHMQPAGNTPYDPVTVWSREDELRTQQLLDGRSRRFVEFLDIALENMAGDASVRVAQSKGYTKLHRQQPAEPPHNIQSRDALHKQGTDQGSDQKGAAPLTRYRSELKRAILMQISQNPKATDLEICRGLDADGAVELPSGWKLRGGDRLFAEAYLRTGTKRRVEVAISKVRADLRSKGLLDRR